MRYMGGKFRQRKDIVRCLRELAGTGFDYIKPFCGAMWSATAVIEHLKPRTVVLSDANAALMKMWWHLVRTNDVPPNTVDDATYAAYKNNRDATDWLTAWYGFGCSFGGKYYGGVARRTRGVIADFTSQVNGMMEKVLILKGCKRLRFNVCDYTTYSGISGYVLYLDPPYQGRTRCYGENGIEYDEFWDFVRMVSANNIVITSCFEHPDDMRVIHSWGDTVVRHYAAKNHGDACEVLVIYDA